MAKDKLGLEWKDKDEDDSLYNAMIWALSIGIVIVIITLFLTRPAPESFTELYFNNHTSLPEYTAINQTIPFSFTLHNLENANKTYNYTISTEFYNIDYSCERPELWLEAVNTSDVPTRITETNDPALLLKEQNYSISFNYEIKTGDKIAFKIVDIHNNPKYTILIDYDKNRLFYITNTNTVVSSEILNKTNLHSFNLRVTQKNTTLKLDGETYIFNTSKDYTKGFIQLETIDTYAEFTNVAITRQDTREPITVQIAESQYTAYELTNNNNTYSSENPINLTSYTVKATFRTLSANMILTLRNNMTITYDKDKSTVSINELNTSKSYYVVQNASRTINDLSAKVTNDSIDIYYNDNFVSSINNTNTTITPSISFENITINDFYVRSDDSPITIRYTLPNPKEKTVGILTIDTLKYFKETNSTTDTPSIYNITSGLNEQEKSSLEAYLEMARMNFTNYRTTIVYGDKNRTENFNIALLNTDQTIYAIAINGKNKTLTITYYNASSMLQIEKPNVSIISKNTLIIGVNNTYALQTEKYNVSIFSTNTLIIDVKNSTLSVNMNDKNLFNKKITKYTRGYTLFDYGNVTLFTAQTENRDNGKILLFKRQTNIACNPILINNYIYANNITIPDKGYASINASASLNQTFDIAKVQISLNNNQETVNNSNSSQEIHYWVKQI